MKTNEGTNGEQREQRNLQKHKVAQHKQNPAEDQDKKEDMNVQEKGNYGHQSQDKLHQKTETSNSGTGTKAEGKTDDQGQEPTQKTQKSNGFGQPFQNQRNPGQRKPSRGDVDPMD